MPQKVYSIDEIAKLKQLVNEGVQVTQEMQDLREGLSDTVKAIAQELDIKAATLNKAIKIAHKGDWQAHADAFDDLETLVVTVGKDK